MSRKKQNMEIRIPVPWGHIAAKTWGSPGAKGILLTHGTLDNAGTFDRLISLLPEHYYYVCIDLPGHGLSSHFSPGLPLDFFNYILAIKMVLDYLQWDQCSFIGHSLGGYLGLYFGILYPHKLDKIIVIESIRPLHIPQNYLLDRIRLMHKTAFDAVKNNSQSRIYNQEEVMHALKYRRISALHDKAAEALFQRAVTQVGEDMFRYNRDVRMKIFLQPLFSLEQLKESFKNFTIPILIIIATASVDEYGESRLMEISKQFENNKSYTLAIVEGNHDVHNNYPERVASRVEKFLFELKSNL